MNRDDPGVVQLCGRAGFPLEALQEQRVGGEPRCHHLDGDRTLQAGVRAPVDGGHAAARQHRTNPVAPLQQGADQVPVVIGSLSLHSLRIVRTGAPRTAEGRRLAGMAW